MHGDEQRQLQIGEKRDKARDVDLRQHGDQRDRHQPDEAKAAGRVLARGLAQQVLGVLGHWLLAVEGRVGRRAWRGWRASRRSAALRGGDDLATAPGRGSSSVGSRAPARRWLRLGLGRRFSQLRGGRGWAPVPEPAEAARHEPKEFS